MTSRLGTGNLRTFFLRCTWAGGIDSLESNPELLKRLQIRALVGTEGNLQKLKHFGSAFCWAKVQYIGSIYIWACLHELN